MSSGSAFGVSRRDQLARLTLAVAYAVGAHPSCIAGTAILVRVAEQFGFQLTPRAVAVAGQADDGRVFSTGRAATEHLQAHGAVANDVTIVAEETTWAEDSGFRRTGHLIAFDERGNYLLDPSFEQFVKYGMPDTVIAHGVYPKAAVWQIPLGGKAFVDYLPGADVGGWEDAYELARKESQVMAAVIAAHLKAGGAPNTHGVALDFDGAIVR